MAIRTMRAPESVANSLSLNCVDTVQGIMSPDACMHRGQGGWVDERMERWQVRGREDHSWRTTKSERVSESRKWNGMIRNAMEWHATKPLANRWVQG